jgi:hypothetical protein
LNVNIAYADLRYPNGFAVRRPPGLATTLEMAAEPVKKPIKKKAKVTPKTVSPDEDLLNKAANAAA